MARLRSNTVELVLEPFSHTRVTFKEQAFSEDITYVFRDTLGNIISTYNPRTNTREYRYIRGGATMVLALEASEGTSSS